MWSCHQLRFLNIYNAYTRGTIPGPTSLICFTSTIICVRKDELTNNLKSSVEPFSRYSLNKCLICCYTMQPIENVVLCIMAFDRFRPVHLLYTRSHTSIGWQISKVKSTNITFPRYVDFFRRVLSTTKPILQIIKTQITYIPTATSRMGLQRTPPPGRPTGPEEGPSQGNTSLPSPSQAFAPRNPRVMRSPQSGSTLGSSSSTRPAQILAPAAIEPPSARAIPATPAPQHLAPIDEGNVSTTPSYAPPPPAPARLPSPIPTIPMETIPPAPTYSEPEARRPEPTTPSNKRRKSRHPDPPPPVTQSQNPETSIESTGNQTNIGGTSQIEGTGMYGKRYQLMMDTLELAVKNSSHRMTLVLLFTPSSTMLLLTGRLKEFTKCFPLFAAKNKEIFQDVFESTRAELGEQLLVRLAISLMAKNQELTSRPKQLLQSKLNDLDQL